jgi:hypothetical protein
MLHAASINGYGRHLRRAQTQFKLKSFDPIPKFADQRKRGEIDAFDTPIVLDPADSS